MDRDRYFWRTMKAPVTLIISLFGIFIAVSAQALTLSVTVDSTAPFHVGDSGILVSIRTDEAITVGSTDITLNWDQPGLAVDSVTSSALSSFTYNIDNGIQRVSTASASSAGDVIPAGAVLMTFSFSAPELGTYSLFITDGDGVAPDDLAGTVPPIPPPAILYNTVPGNLIVSPPTGTENTITWSGDRTGSVPTNESTRTQQATQEAFYAIFTDYIGPVDCGGSPYSCSASIPLCALVIQGLFPVVRQDGSWLFYSNNCGAIGGTGVWDVVDNTPVAEWGDIDGTEDVNTVDVLLAMQDALGLAALTPEQRARGNVAPLIGGIPNPSDPYEQLNAADILLIMQKALGIAVF